MESERVSKVAEEIIKNITVTTPNGTCPVGSPFERVSCLKTGEEDSCGCIGVCEREKRMIEALLHPTRFLKKGLTGKDQ